MEDKCSKCDSCLNKKDCPAMPNDKMWKNPEVIIHCEKYKQIPFDSWGD